MIKHWSSTQKVVTLRSGEAELGGIAKGTTEALGIQSLGRDLGIQMAVHVHADSAAAIGICKRSGIGRVRRLAVGQLLGLEGLRRGDFALFKVQGESHPAGALAEHLARDALDKRLAAMSVRRATGRASTEPKARLT